MKKLIALIAVCGFAFAFVACGAKKEAAENADTTTVVEETVVAPDTTAADTVKTDTTTAQ